MGITSVMSTMGAFLADALATQGAAEDDAVRYSRLSESSAADEDVVTQVMWRVARAKATIDEDLALEAVRLAEPTDYPDLKARAFLALAQVSDRPSARQRAAGEYERKGNLAAVARLAASRLPS